MAKGLARRGGVWWARLVVPERLRSAAGRREFTQSCRTSDAQVAKLVAAVLVTGWRRRLLTLESVTMSSEVLKLIDPAPALMAGGCLPIGQAAAAIGIDCAQLWRRAASGALRLYARLPSTQGYTVLFAELERDGGGVAVPLPRNMPDAAVSCELRGLLAIPTAEGAALANAIQAERLETVSILLLEVPDRPGYVFAPDREPQLLVEALEVEAAQVEVFRQSVAAMLTHDQIQRAKELHAASIKSATVSMGSKAHELFSVALEAYATAPGGLPANLVSESEQKQKRSGCARFIELVGDLPLCEVSPDRLREFREKIKSLPNRENHIPKEYRRGTMLATIEALYKDKPDWPRMSEGARHDRMLWLDQMFRWLLAQGGWLKENPMALVISEQTKTAADRKTERQIADQKKAENKANDSGDDSDNRNPFKSEELLAIFDHLQYKKGNGAHVKRESEWYPFEYWLPVIGLHAGCRIKEVSQLHLSDIRRDANDGVWYFDINDLTLDKSLKNKQSARHIPVSPVLIELGLIDYRNRLEKEGYQRLFPELSYSKSDAKYAKESKRRMSVMLDDLGMPRDGTKVYHCLRKNFNDALMRVPLTALPFDNQFLAMFIQMETMGHKIDDINRKHYTSASMRERLALVAGIVYVGLPRIERFDIEFAVERVRYAISRKVGFRSGREDMGPLNAS